MKDSFWLTGQRDRVVSGLRQLRGARNTLTGGKPSSAVRHAIRAGNLHRDAGEWMLAQEHYAHALALDPSLAHIWVQHGHALKQSGKIFDALAAYSTAASLSPKVADTHIQLGHALKLQGRLEEAESAYAHAFALDPSSLPAWQELQALKVRRAEMSLDGRTDHADTDTADERMSSLWPDISAKLSIPSLTGKSDYQSLGDLLTRNHLLPSFLGTFDPEYYAYCRKRDRRLLPSSPVECLTHFCETGIFDCTPIAERLVFDAQFYSEVGNIAFPMSTADAYRHWLNFGLTHGIAPNLTVWLHDAEGVDVRDFSKIDLAYFQAANPTLEITKTTDLVVHILNGGLIEEENPIRPTRENAEIFAAAAQRAAKQGKLELSTRITEQLLAYIPDYENTLSHYADRLVDNGRHQAAADLYQRVIDSGQATHWTYILLAGCRRAQKQFRLAFEILSQGVLAFPQYPKVRYERDVVLEEYFHACVREYEGLARLNRIREGQALITDYARLATAPLFAEKITPKPIEAIALFALLDLPQCKFYRVDQKVEHLERAGFTVTLYDANTDLTRFLSEITRYQAVIFYRLAPLPNVIPAIQAANSLGVITFYEIDDLLFLPDEYPGSFESYAGQITRDVFTMLAMGVPLFARAMAMCQYALASTPTLAREMARFVSSGRAFTHRNGMGSDHEQYLDYVPHLHSNRPVTIFYGSGTRAHKEDFQQLIEPALIELARRHGEKVAFILVGWLPISDALRRQCSNLTVIEPVFNLHEYWDLLKQADINIAVLKPSLNVDCKSEIKWMEAALFGVPSAVSRTATYAEVIQHGETGFLCETVEDWVETLDRLVRDENLRRRVGLRAQAVVRENYNIGQMAQNIRSIMQAVSPTPVGQKRRKVLLVNVFYTPQTYGGATRVLHDNIVYLREHYGDEFELEVFTCVDEAREEYVVESYVQDGIRVTAVTRSVEGEKSAELSDPRMDEIFRAHVALSDPDLIHFHCIQRLSLAVVLVARELKIPYLITAHDAWWISDNQFILDAQDREQVYDFNNPMEVLSRYGQRSFARMQAIRPALFGARQVLGVSEPFSTLYARCGVPNVLTIANGVSALPPCVRTTSSDGRVRVGHVGGMTRHKGYNLLKYAVMSGSYQNLHVVVVDHSKLKGYVRREEWGTTPVTFIGKFRQDEVTDLYGQIDVLMAPSLWTESFGLATREALTCGCWVVASDRGAIGGDVIENVNGHVIDVSNLDGLSAILSRIDRNPDQYRSPPKATLPLRSADMQGKELSSLYRDLLMN
jgi:glycosyltransferase involved in cell wall biosynthesis